MIVQNYSKDEVLREYIHEGKIKAELDELFAKVFQKETYAGVDINMEQAPIRVSITILNPINYLGDNKVKLLQLQNMVAQRLGVPMTNVVIVFEKIEDKRLEPAYHCEQLRQTFIAGKPYKKVVNQTIRAVKNAGGQGVCVRVSGKVRGQRARTIKFIDGLLIQAGQPAKDYIKKAKTAAHCKQGVIGVQVSIMLPHDPEGIKGPSTVIADKISVIPPKAL